MNLIDAAIAETRLRDAAPALLDAAEKALFALCSIEPTTENLAARKHLREAIDKAAGTQR
jgi:hypothetical protein